jgi:hypothetical protein
MEALRGPVVTISRRFGRLSITSAGSGVRSRITQTLWKGCNRSTSAWPEIVSRNTVTSSPDQSARSSARPA